jgi:uncharacterized protein (TIGR00255 family)
MTGFGRGEGVHGALGWLWEVRSVNGRGLDVKLRLPGGFEALEPAAREAAAKRFKRGSLQATLSFARGEAQAAPVRVDHALARKLIDEGVRYIDAGDAAKPNWDGILQVRGVVVFEEAEAMDEATRAALHTALVVGLNTALDDLDAARRNEGKMLADLLRGAADRIDALGAAARATSAAAPAAALDRIKQKLAQLSPDVQFDAQRVAQEAALAALRADVQEELDRLAAHAAELRALLASAEPIGRRLDFLTQELGREANTLG